MKYSIAVTGLVMMFAAGCGGSSLPAEKLTDAKSTVRAAEEAGAEGTPQAALHLKMANDELAASEKASNDKDGDRAQMLLNQAQADADLALALARGTTQKQQAQEAQAKVDGLLKQPQ